MDYATLDHLCLFAEPSHARFEQELRKKGIVDHNGNPDTNMINMITGTFTGELVCKLFQEQYDIQLIYNHLTKLVAENEIHAAYYFVYTIIKAIDMEMPPMFIQIYSMPKALKTYLEELLADYFDCMKDCIDEDGTD